MLLNEITNLPDGKDWHVHVEATSFSMDTHGRRTPNFTTGSREFATVQHALQEVIKLGKSHFELEAGEEYPDWFHDMNKTWSAMTVNDLLREKDFGADHVELKTGRYFYDLDHDATIIMSNSATASTNVDNITPNVSLKGSSKSSANRTNRARTLANKFDVMDHIKPTK